MTGREPWREGLPIWWALMDDVFADMGLATLTDLWIQAKDRTKVHLRPAAGGAA